MESLCKNLCMGRFELPNDVAVYYNLFLARGSVENVCIVNGRPTFLSSVLDELIKEKTKAELEKKLDRASGYHLLVGSGFGATASIHRVIGSKACARIVRDTARYCL
ncbi:hypothetical protein ColTof4_14453 [Colletotrichum tofieldiae]|nr:hypothetical protein ColTof3_14825 [Colletotrichum tofieldiae]GKT82030.1 hypothetical protein ColTof4_14453 [Colletotrichum tofieldiae]